MCDNSSKFPTGKFVSLTLPCNACERQREREMEKMFSELGGGGREHHFVRRFPGFACSSFWLQQYKMKTNKAEDMKKEKKALKLQQLVLNEGH